MDQQVITNCKKISELIAQEISDIELRNIFIDKFGKTHLSRDAGTGRGAGKLQRDALCTRGTTAKAPISNRNLRWHPLVVASKAVNEAKAILKLELDERTKQLNFLIEDEEKNEKSISPEDIYLLPQRYVVTDAHWHDINSKVATWSDDDWTRNACLIQAAEACSPIDAIETFAVLGISIAASKFGGKSQLIMDKTVEYLASIDLWKNVDLPTSKFPKDAADLLNCPVCKKSLTDDLDEFRIEEARIEAWQPGWRQNKRAEGEDASLQVMHVNPLNERAFLHNAHNVRYGHRWCNVSMTDHSLEETLSFMLHIVGAHDKK